MSGPHRALRSRLLAALLAALAGAAGAATRPDDLTELSPSELAELEVTSVSKKPEKRSEVPAAVHVITNEDLRRTGVTSLVEALRLAPGVDVGRINSNQWAVGIRGFASRLSRSQLALIDGRSVYTPLFAGTYWEVQDTLLEDVDRIEVVRGPGGTLWGANAVNGVVNVITKSAKETHGLYAEAGGGSEERGFGAIRYGGTLGGSADYRVYAKYFDRGPAFHADVDGFDAWHLGQAGFRVDGQAGTSGSFTVQGDLYDGRNGQRASITSFAPPALRPVEQDVRVSGGNLVGRWQRTLAGGSTLAVQAYYDRTDRSEPTFGETRDTLDLDVQHHVGLARVHDVVWGFGYRVSDGRARNTPGVGFEPPDRTDQLVSAFAQDEIGTSGGPVHLTLGAKLEHNGYSGFELQPSARLLWRLRPKQALWLAVSRAVRTPSRVDTDVFVTSLADPRGIFIRLLGDKDFRPERAVVTEVGYRVQRGERLTLDLAAFYNHYHDLLGAELRSPFVESAPPPPRIVFPVLFENALEAKAYGGEIVADARPTSRLRFSAAYSFLRLDTRPERAIPGLLPDATEGSSPRHQLVLRAALDLPHATSLDLLFRRVGALPAQQVPGYSSLDLRGAWRPGPHVELAVVGQDLIDAHHVEFVDSSTPRAAIERGVYAKVALRW